MYPYFCKAVIVFIRASIYPHHMYLMKITISNKMHIVLNSLELMRIYGYLIMPIKHICIPYLQHCLIICGNDVLILKYTPSTWPGY